MKLKPIAMGISVLLITAGCASNQSGETSSLTIKPITKIQQGGTTPAALYQLGRYYQGQRRYEAALEAYEKARAADRNFVEALNGIGVVHAQRGEFGQATEAFNAAIALAPQSAHLYNNLGYSQLMEGANASAVQSFKKALELDPQSERTMTNLKLAYEKLGEPDKAQQITELSRENLATRQASAKAMTPADASRPPGFQLSQVAPNVYELHPAPPAAPSAMKKIDSSPVAQKPFRLEVSNGNGFTGMAKHVSGWLKGEGFTPVRLTNDKPFNKPATQIQYRAGYQKEAEKLNTALSRPAALFETNRLRADIQVRLVLGKDFNGKAAASSSASDPAAR